MCRLALMNYQGALEIQEKYGLTKFFQYLEDKNGGHGNGIAIIRNGRIKIVKGLAFTCENASKEILRKPFEWAIFHTRIASAGTINNRNCHPFVDGGIVLAMNGTEQGFTRLGKALGDITDTEAVLKTMIKFNLNSKFLINLTAVYIGFEDKKPFVAVGGYGDLQFIVNEYAGGIVFASEFPQEFGTVYEPAKRPFYWKGDRKGHFKIPANANLVNNTKTYYYYGFNNYRYNYDYDDYVFNNSKKRKEEIKDE